jgi:hypothetical protein
MIGIIEFSDTVHFPMEGVAVCSCKNFNSVPGETKVSHYKHDFNFRQSKLKDSPRGEKSSEDSKDSKNQDEHNNGNEKTRSLTHKTAGVNITVSIRDEKDGKDEGSGGEKSGAAGGDEKDKNDKDKKRNRRFTKKPAFILTDIIITVILVVGGIILWLILRQFISTDDAYIDGNFTQVSPQISALTLALHINDNQFVHKGNLLIELDPTDYEVALAQARAQVFSALGKLAQARAQIETAKAPVIQVAAEVDAAQVQFDNATRDLERYKNVDPRARSQQQLDNALMTQKTRRRNWNRRRRKKFRRMRT